MNLVIFPWKKRRLDLKETTDIGSGADQGAIIESYESMEKGVEKIYGRWMWPWLEALKLKGKILDIGCGSGNIDLELLQRIPNIKIVAFDKNPVALSLAQERKKQSDIDGRLAIRKGIAEELTKLFEPKSFDTVVLIETLHHFSNPSNVLKNIAEVLNAGGKLIIFEVARNWLAWILSKLLTDILKVIPSKDFERSVLRGFSPREMKTLLESQGFQIKKLQLIAGHFNACVAEKR